MEYLVELYEKADGKVPVLDFILSLNPKQQAKIYREIDLLEKFGNELHYPHVDTIIGSDERIFTEEKRMNWSNAKAIILKNNDVQKELKKNEAEYTIIEELITTRKEKNMTQKDLAKLIGTRQSNISRFEHGNYNPSLEFLNKIASAMGKELEVRMV